MTFLLVRKEVGKVKVRTVSESLAVRTGLCIPLWTGLFTATSAGVAKGKLKGNKLICDMCTSVPTVTIACNPHPPGNQGNLRVW